MRPTLANTLLDALAEPHRNGHRCLDGQWWNPNAGTRTPCPDLTRLTTLREQVARLHTQVHEAAHDTATATAVAQAMVCPGATPDDDLDDWHALPGEVQDGWVHLARLAIEGLSCQLDRDPQLEARVAAVRERLAAAGLDPDPTD